MRSVVLGGSGFIGSHLVKDLVGRGQEVSVFCRKAAPELAQLNRVRLFRGDFTTGEGLKEALAGADHCYHLVSATVPASSINDPMLEAEINLKPTIKFLEMAKSAGIKKIIFCSSGGTVYGIPKTIPIEETMPLWPISPYGIVKAAIEMSLHMFYVLNGLDYDIARISNPYGEGQRSTIVGAATVFVQRALRGEEIEIWGDGSVVRDFIHIDDAVKGLIAIAEHEGPEKVFNIGSGEGQSLNDLLALIKKLLGHPIHVKYLEARRFDVPVNVLSIARARSTLGWSPKISFEDGVKRVIAWVRSENPSIS